jgi:DNA replication protein DnaC
MTAHRAGWIRPGLLLHARAQRYGTSNQSRAWGEVFGDPVIASAILDRLLHHSSTINMKGKSYRREKLKAGLVKSKTAPEGGADLQRPPRRR